MFPVEFWNGTAKKDGVYANLVLCDWRYFRYPSWFCFSPCIILVGSRHWQTWYDNRIWFYNTFLAIWLLFSKWCLLNRSLFSITYSVLLLNITRTLTFKSTYVCANITTGIAHKDCLALISFKQLNYNGNPSHPASSFIVGLLVIIY